MLKSSLNSLPHVNADCAAVDGGVLSVHWLCADDNVVRTDNAEHKKAVIAVFPCSFLSWLPLQRLTQIFDCLQFTIYL